MLPFWGHSVYLAEILNKKQLVDSKATIITETMLPQVEIVTQLTSDLSQPGGTNQRNVLTAVSL